MGDELGCCAEVLGAVGCPVDVPVLLAPPPVVDVTGAWADDEPGPDVAPAPVDDAPLWELGRTRIEDCEVLAVPGSDTGEVPGRPGADPAAPDEPGEPGEPGTVPDAPGNVPGAPAEDPPPPERPTAELPPAELPPEGAGTDEPLFCDFEELDDAGVGVGFVSLLWVSARAATPANTAAALPSAMSGAFKPAMAPMLCALPAPTAVAPAPLPDAAAPAAPTPAAAAPAPASGASIW